MAGGVMFCNRGLHLENKAMVQRNFMFVGDGVKVSVLLKIFFSKAAF